MELAFQLKGRLFTLSVLHMMSTDMTFIETQLSQKVQQAPQFFNNTPMVIDLSEVENSIEQVNLDEFRNLLAKYQILPVGFIAHSKETKEYIKSFNLPIIKEARATAKPKESTAKTPLPTNTTACSTVTIKENTQQNKSSSIIIYKQVRSGQQIYAPDGDLIVLAPVSSGAELLAEGNIHVYGPLRGRALAGINGDVSARIFCKSLEANIVSIAGQYKLLDDTSGIPNNVPQQIYLQNGQLIIKAI